MKFTTNIGQTDRIVRFVLGVVLLAIGFFAPMTSAALQIVLVILGVLMLVTAFIRFCPLYLPFKFSTKK